MTPDYFSFGPGRVTFWDMMNVEPDRSAIEQVEELKEDLIQVVYGPRTVLDVGWYPSFEDAGCFIVSLIHDQNWELPVFSGECRSWCALRKVIAQAVARVDEIER